MTLSLEHQSGILSNLLSRGVALLAEVFRLRTTLPGDMFDTSKSRFKSILTDFSYFETPIEFDQRIEDNVALRDLDKEFTELHRDYVLDFSKFMRRLCSFIFEFSEYTQKYAAIDVMLDTEWNQIHSRRANVLYHLGIILVFLDEKFVASSREALFVAGQRLGDKFTSTHFETSISLLRERKDVFENCFIHLGVDRKFVENVLQYVRTFSLIQTQDVDMSSRKSSLVYIALWFIPNVLRDEGPLMRTLVDSFFGDQWILCLHFELTANVLEKWKNYKPAVLALNGVLRQEHVALIVQQKIEILKSNKFPSGFLSLDEFEYYKKTLVVCNSALKWIILHFGDLERFKKLSILFDPFKYLLTLIKFEYKFKQSALFTIKNKNMQVDKLKERIFSTIDQAVLILDRSQESCKTKVSAWLGKIKDKLSTIGADNTKSVNIIESVKLKLEEICEITSDDQRVISQYLEVILKNMDSLKTVILLNFDFLNTLDAQCDSDYLWKCISGWVQKLENLLQSEPVMVKYFFFKLMSPIQIKVAGMSTEKSEAISVFYHKILETYLKRIIQAIPRSVFVELEELQSLLIDDEYCFIEKSNVKNIIQSERRRKLAEKTCKISKLSLGISNMCLSKLGQIELKPENMLYDGLKQELRLKLNQVLSGVIPINTFFNILKQQREELNKLRKTFLFVCQQIGINGVQVWQTELSAITIDALNSCFSKFTSEKQSAPLKSTAFNAFILKMLQSTDPTSTVFSLKSLEWWNQTKSKLEYSTTILLIAHQWIPSFLLIGIRRIIQKIMVNEINNLGVLLMRHHNIGPVDQIGSIDQFTKTQEFLKLYNACLPLISKIGQYTVLNDALNISIGESSISEVSLLRKTAKTALDYSQLQETKSGVESMDIPKQLEAILEKTGLVDYSHLVVPLPPFSKSRNSLILFSMLSQCLSTNAVTTKKSEFMDSFSIVKGIEKIKCCFELDYQFEYPLSITSGDSAGYLVARRLKIDKINYPFKNVPEPFRK